MSLCARYGADIGFHLLFRHQRVRERELDSAPVACRVAAVDARVDTGNNIRNVRAKYRDSRGAAEADTLHTALEAWPGSVRARACSRGLAGSLLIDG